MILDADKLPWRDVRCENDRNAVAAWYLISSILHFYPDLTWSRIAEQVASRQSTEAEYVRWYWITLNVMTSAVQNGLAARRGSYDRATGHDARRLTIL